PGAAAHGERVARGRRPLVRGGARRRGDRRPGHLPGPRRLRRRDGTRADSAHDVAGSGMRPRTSVRPPLMPTGTDRRVVEPMVVYAALAYGISWAYWLPLAWAGRLVVGGWPTHLPGLAGPAAAAVVVSLVFGGREAVERLAGRVLRW